MGCTLYKKKVYMFSIICTISIYTTCYTISFDLSKDRIIRFPCTHDARRYVLYTKLDPPSKVIVSAPKGPPIDRRCIQI